jgi:hypothetical protein
VSWLPPAIGSVGVGLVAASILLGRPVLVAWSVAALGAEYAAWLALDGGGTNTRAPLVAAGLVLVAELGYEAQTPPAGEVEPEVLLRRLVLLAGVALGAIAVGAIVLGIASVPLSGGVALTAIGAAAAVLALVVVWRIAAGRQ